MAVVLENVSVKYGQTTALDRVSLSIGQSMIFALCGPSGSGKTSVILSILDQVQLSAGQVRIFGSKSRGKSLVPGQNVGK